MQRDSIVPDYGDGVPGIVREKIDGAVEAGKSAVTNFGWEASSKGIGQGVIAAALLVMGAYMVPAALDGPGLQAGFNAGLQAFFDQPMVWVTLGFGAAFGAIMDVQNDHTNLEKDLAGTRANVQAMQKDLSQVKQTVINLEKIVTDSPDFVAREELRRSAAACTKGVV